MIKNILILLAILFVPVSALAASADVKLLRQARSQVGLVAGELQQKISEDAGRRGPEKALLSCRLRVDGLVDRLTDHSGWEIRRTAFKLRNPTNAPDDWEREVLDLFALRASEGVDLERFEFARLVEKDGHRVFRYMKPIVMQQNCIVCHGSNVAPHVAGAIAEKYPDDRATGFKAGELRGAFSLLKVLPGGPPGK